MIILTADGIKKSYLYSISAQTLIVFTTLLFCLSASDGFAQQKTLSDFARAHGKWIGTAVKSSYTKNPNSVSESYQKIVASEFNIYVSENDFKMSSILKTRPENPFQIKISDLHTAGIDRLTKQASANKISKIRGHTLIWYRQAPEWLNQEAKTWNSQQIHSFAASYITAVLTYCKTKNAGIDDWDVVNEAIDDNASALRSDTWYDGVSDKQEFIDNCFHAARKADSKVRLTYNDYNVELTDGSSKNAYLLKMVAGMKKRRVPLDAVGIQSHFMGPDQNGEGGFTEAHADDFRKTFVALRHLKLYCIVTELDLRLPTDDENKEGNVTQIQLAEQGKQYQLIVSTALSEPNSPYLLLWGFSDHYSWIPSHFKGQGHGLLFDKNNQKKPAYHGIYNALNSLKKR